MLGSGFLVSQAAPECPDLVAFQREIMIEQEWIGKTAFIKGAVNLHGDDSLPIALSHIDYIKCDIPAEDLLLGPYSNRSGAAKLSSHVRYHSVGREAREEPVGIMLVVARMKVAIGCRIVNSFFIASVVSTFLLTAG